MRMQALRMFSICGFVLGLTQGLAGAQWLSSERYGDGSAGALTISSTQTWSAAKTSFSGSAGGTTGTVGSNFGFAVDDIVLIHQSRNGGAGAGTWQLNRITAINGSTLTFAHALDANFNTTAQLVALAKYLSVTVNGGVTLNAPTWDGSSGGVVAILARESITVSGSISASGKGYQTSGQCTVAGQALAGEGSAGSAVAQQPANGSGGGGGQSNGGAWEASGGGGGGHGAAGSGGANGTGGTGAPGGAAGAAAGNQELTLLAFGGAGGQGGRYLPDNGARGGSNGSGGGIVLLIAPTISVTGSIVTNGDNGGGGTGAESGGGGGGAGGAVLLKGNEITLGTNLVTATGGGGGAKTGRGGVGGTGAVGRIHVDYATSISGSTNPAMHITQDSNLVPNAVPTPFSLSTPAHQTNTADNRPTFGWAPSTDPESEPIMYTLKLSTTVDFTDPIYRTIAGLAATSYTPALGQEIANGSYYWKVVAFDGEMTTTSTQTFELTISATPPAIPTVTGVLADTLTGKIVRLIGQADSSQGQVLSVHQRDSGTGQYVAVSGSAAWDGDSFTFDPTTPLDSGAMLYVTTGDGGQNNTDSRVGVASFDYVTGVFRDESVFHGAGPGVALRLEQDTSYRFRLAVNAGQQVSVSAWVRKSVAYSGTQPKITLTGLGIAGTGAATASMTVGADTWQQLTVSGTPNASGVLTLTMETFSSSSGAAAWIDDIEVAQ